MSIPERLDEAMREQKENPDGTLKSAWRRECKEVVEHVRKLRERGYL